jgi:tetratricopeptide (TPR) repeat protein
VNVPIVVLVLLAGAAVGLQAVHERRGGLPAASTPNLLYVRSPEAMKRLALSYDALLADVYWIRTVQHYGGTRRSNDPNRRYDLLYPLLDLTTSLDPRFNGAYLFGALFLSEPPPGGPGRPDQAIAMLEKGLRAQPDKWEFAQAIGFVHYWWRQDYTEAAAWFRRAAQMPGGPFWLTSMAAVTLAEGGRRESSRMLWEELARSDLDFFRSEAQRRLQQLDAMDQIDRLQEAADAYERQFGRDAAQWDDLRRAGYLRGNPADPTGVAYRIESGVVSLGRGSRLFPLPVQPPRFGR